MGSRGKSIPLKRRPEERGVRALGKDLKCRPDLQSKGERKKGKEGWGEREMISFVALCHEVSTKGGKIKSSVKRKKYRSENLAIQLAVPRGALGEKERKDFKVRCEEV